MSHSRIVASLALVVVAASPAFAQTSGRLGPSGLAVKYPGKQRVYATGAKASTSYGRGYMASEAVGPPNVFPRFQDGKKAWACKDKRSTAEWLEVTFPPTKAKALIVFETWKPGAIMRIVVGKKVVFEAGKLRRYREAQGLWVEFGGEGLTIDRVRIEVNPARVRYYPEIDAVALVPMGGAEPSQVSGGAKPPEKAQPEEAELTKARAELDAAKSGLATLKAGDIDGANLLLTKVKAANVLLGACKKRRGTAWMETVTRSRAIDANIRSVARKRPAEASTPTTKTPARVNTAKTGKPGPMPADTPPMSPRDRVKWRRFGPVTQRGLQVLVAATPRSLAPIAKSNRWAGWLNEQRAQLETFQNKTHPRILWAHRALATSSKLLKTKQAEGRKELGLPDLASVRAAQAKAAKPTADPRKLLVAIGPPNSVGPAIGEGRFLHPEEFAARTKAETPVYATAALASSAYETRTGRPDQYGATRATGAPDVFPALKDNHLAWKPATNKQKDWLEVGFPKTKARCVYVYQNHGLGTIRLISTRGGAILFRHPKGKLERSPGEAQVLCVTLPKPMEIDRVRILVDSRFVPKKGEYPEIDAVALGTQGPASGAFTRTSWPWSRDDEFYFARVRPKVTKLQRNAARWEGTVIPRKPGELQITTSSVRLTADRITGRTHPKYLQLMKDIEGIDARAQELKVVSERELANLGPNARARCEADSKFIAQRYSVHEQHNKILPRPPEEATEAAYAAFGAKLKSAVPDLKRRLAFIARAEVWLPGKGCAGPRTIYAAEAYGLEALARATKRVDEIKEWVRGAQSVDPRDVDVKTLRQSAWGVTSNTMLYLNRQVEAGKLAIAFDKAYAPDPSFAFDYADVLSRVDALEGFVKAQVARERLPAEPVKSASLRTIAKGLLTKYSHVSVTTKKETHEGVWTSRSLVSSEDHGTYTKKTYRVTGKPYKYDGFWVSAVLPHPTNPDWVMVRDIGIRFYHMGGQPMRKWHTYMDEQRFIMLKKNLPPK